MSKEIGDFIRRKRKDSNMTLKQVSERAGISYPYLSTLETGKRDNPSAEVLNNIAGVLNIPSVDILTVGGYLTSTDMEKVSSKKTGGWELQRMTPLDILVELSPEIVRNIFKSYIKKSGLKIADYELLNLSDIVLEKITTKEYVDSLILNHKEFFHLYVFLAATAQYIHESISESEIWKWSQNIEEMKNTVENELHFEAFNLWYKFYFSKNILTEYGDYVLRNSEGHAFDLGPLLKSDIVLLNGKILSPKVVESLKGLLNNLQ
ncbi:helix-turn-helix domain-containing protein [Planococcus donghaensis]|uniref:helix-turn-helix domain-containing protein n=1 Tax=Planococcus donghaensis TaxID=414778 RepID=UPI0037368EB0